MSDGTVQPGTNDNADEIGLSSVNLSATVRLWVLMRKHLASGFFSRLRAPALAIVAVLHWVLWVAPCLAADFDSEAAPLIAQVAELFQSGKYQEAIPVSKQLLEMYEKELGPEHPYTATCLDNLADLHREMGEYSKAEPLYQRALAIREKMLGAEHSETASSLSDLAELWRQMGEYSKAEPVQRRALAIKEKALGMEHSETSTALNNLALLYRSMGDYVKAEPLYQRALAIYEKALGLEHIQTAVALNNLGLLYKIMGDYAKAEPLYERALAIREKMLGPEHPWTASSLNNLAGLYKTMGDYTKAEPFYRRALAIREKALGPEHPSTATSLDNLAEFYYSMRDYAKAEPLYQRALAIKEKAVGPEHPSMATSLNNLAGLYESTGDYAKAEPLYWRALAVREKVLGSEHPSTADSLNDLAVLYESMGDYVRAEPLHQRALAITEKTHGPEHPSTAISLENLAWLDIDLGKTESAREMCMRAARAHEAQLGNILSFTSEEQRLAFQKTTTPFTLAATLGNAPDIAEAILHHKGVVLDSLLEDRLVAEASKNAKDREVIDRLRAAKQQYTKLLMEIPGDVSAEARQRRQAELKTRGGEVEQLEATLARQVSGLGRARRALSVTVAQVQDALAGDQVLVELLRHPHYLGKNKWERRYGALVITSGDEPRWVPLGAAPAIETNVELYRKSVRGNTDETTLHSVIRALNDQVWAPIEKALPAGTKTVILSPDGKLNFVSFATLLSADDKFLIEKYSVGYVASGRDLLLEREEPVSELLAVFGNPDFGSESELMDQQTASTGLIAMRASEMRDFANVSLRALPGTERECAGLKAQGEASGKPIELFLGTDATEAQLRKVNSPRILHLATHGFFLPESRDEHSVKESGVGTDKMTKIGQASAPSTPVILKNPMHRSGLALAGAQRTLQAWSAGEVPPSDNDGIVTAEEVGGLKLKGTWLVVLSACETGIGQAKAGEGVMGLRRGFIQAGAQNLLMTLWPISDETTVRIMSDFYDHAISSGNALQSLLDVQRQWLIKLRKEKGLFYAVNRAGPFITSSQGNAGLAVASGK